MRRPAGILVVKTLVALLAFAAAAVQAAPVPVVVDTDIGTDIDDAYALALILKSPELELRGVTTVSGDAALRARLAAKLLWTAGKGARQIPVYAGASGPKQPQEQSAWVGDFKSPALHLSGGVEFLCHEIDQHPGELTIVALGELTNIAAVLAAEPGITARIKRIVLMGGALHRGYAPGSPPEPEWNIKSNPAAAQAVFASGIPLVMAPLDATITLRLEAPAREKVFATGTPLTDLLAALTATWQKTNPWKQDTPVLYDVLPAAWLIAPANYPTTPLAIEVTDAGVTRPVPGRSPNADAVLECAPDKFSDFVTGRLSAP